MVRAERAPKRRMTSGINWYHIKLFASHATGLSLDALHMAIGVLLHLVLALVLRRSLASPLPLLLLFVLEVLNETNDIAVERWPDTAMQAGEVAKDVIATMFLPTVLFLVARRRPQLLR